MGKYIRLEWLLDNLKAMRASGMGKRTVCDELRDMAIGSYDKDVVEVVRCGECKWRDEQVGMGEHKWCKKIGGTYTPNDYCSYGERKDGESE